MINKKQVLKTFVDLIKIDSPSGEEKKLADYIIRYLRKIKVMARRDRYGNVIARVAGAGKPLILTAHMDTVEPGRGIKPIIRGDIVKSDGTTILGADDKGGIAPILETVRYLKRNNIKHRPLELIFTREEEIGLLGAANLDFSKIKSREGIVIDKGGVPLGQVTLASPFIYSIKIRIKGRSAHAGVEPESGINAIQIASKAIAELKIGRISRETTNNIGVIKGGTAPNSVPEMVEIKAEARSHNLKEAQRQVDLINRAFKKYTRQFKAKLYFKTTLGCYGYSYSKNDKFIRKIIDLNKKMGIKTVLGISGGGSDANVFAGKRIKVIDISYGSFNIHTKKESIRISSLVKLTEFLAEFLKIV